MMPAYGSPNRQAHSATAEAASAIFRIARVHSQVHGAQPSGRDRAATARLRFAGHSPCGPPRAPDGRPRQHRSLGERRRWGSRVAAASTRLHRRPTTAGPSRSRFPTAARRCGRRGVGSISKMLVMYVLLKIGPAGPHQDDPRREDRSSPHLRPHHGGPNGPLMDVIGPRGSTKPQVGTILWPRQAREGRSSRRSTIRRFITE
jgi:hypothetical protein